MILVRILKCCGLFGRVIDGPHVMRMMTRRRKQKEVHRIAWKQTSWLLRYRILPRIEIDPVGEGAPREHRKVVRIAREMFTSSIEEDVTGMIMSHTKLRHICMRPGPDRNAF